MIADSSALLLGGINMLHRREDKRLSSHDFSRGLPAAKFCDQDLLRSIRRRGISLRYM